MKRKVWRTMELREAYERYLAGDDYEEIAKAAGCMTVVIHRLLVKGGMDEDVAAALEGKRDTQDALLAALKARIGKVKGRVGVEL